MPKQDPEVSALKEQLAEAQAQIEALQAAAADAEARAATAQAELVEARERTSQLESELAPARAELAEAQAARDSAQAELADARSHLSEARQQLQQAALRYREARLAAAPHIPADLVPAPADDRPGGEALDEIDRQFEAAQRVVSQLREKLEDETRSARVPLGSPPRRAPDLSALSPTEKIKLGLQQLGGR